MIDPDIREALEKRAREAEAINTLPPGHFHTTTPLQESFSNEEALVSGLKRACEMLEYVQVSLRNRAGELFMEDDLLMETAESLRECHNDVREVRQLLDNLLESR